ncbi:Rdx family protein [Sorangium cellulosum]|uniref:Uncharacterized protein n=1 Tax=Sorangium cellulosum TaxID=56 RepID=A0A150QEH4_SORCE|nr:Rdx family protein [Sorangium cellulosum]KYF66313.1 hypothetical protein BE15_33535 [Sorangium cellulosum]
MSTSRSQERRQESLSLATQLLDGALLFSRAAAERFPEPKELKRAIRDSIDPERSLGHSDR